MKKLALLLSLALLSGLLCACGLLSPPADTTGGSDTTGGTPTTGSAPTPAEVEAGIRAARPTETRVTVSAAYAASGITLTAQITLKKNGESEYYTYEAERLLPTDEALAAGSPTATVEGHLQLSGNQVVSSSAEVDAELLSGVSSLSVHLPRLNAAYLSSYEITEGSEGVTLTATVRDDRLGEMLDAAAEISGLSFTLTLTRDLTPTALTAEWTSPDGAAVTYGAEYSYTPAAIP